MTPRFRALLRYARRRVRFDAFSVFEIIGMVGALALGAAWSYAVYWVCFG